MIVIGNDALDWARMERIGSEDVIGNQGAGHEVGRNGWHKHASCAKLIVTRSADQDWMEMGWIG